MGPRAGPRAAYSGRLHPSTASIKLSRAERWHHGVSPSRHCREKAHNQGLSVQSIRLKDKASIYCELLQRSRSAQEPGAPSWLCFEKPGRIIKSAVAAVVPRLANHTGGRKPTFYLALHLPVDWPAQAALGPDRDSSVGRPHPLATHICQQRADMGHRRVGHSETKEWRLRCKRSRRSQNA